MPNCINSGWSQYTIAIMLATRSQLPLASAFTCRHEAVAKYNIDSEDTYTKFITTATSQPLVVDFLGQCAIVVQLWTMHVATTYPLMQVHTKMMWLESHVFGHWPYIKSTYIL